MQKFKFELDVAMIEIIGKALGNAPHDMVRPVIEELQKQINGQQTQNGQDIEIPKNERPAKRAS